jgi:hypothetical protein
VIGVVAEKLNAIKFAKVTGELPENINFAIKTGAVRDFLDNSVVPYRVAEPGAELKTSEIAENARKSGRFALLLQRTSQYAEAADYWRRYLGSDCQPEWASRARRSLKFCEMQVNLIAPA